MAAEHDAASMGALWKTRFGDLENVIPEEVTFIRDINFAEKSVQLGESFKQAVLLTREHGFTYVGPSSTGAPTLNAANPGITKQASVVPSQMYLRSQISYEVAARACKNDGRAFKPTLSVVVENMWGSMYHRGEMDTLYGRSGVGKVLSINHTTGVITLNQAEFAGAHWVGMENALLMAHASVNNTSTRHSGTAGLTITAVNIESRQLTVTGTHTNVTVGSILSYYGQRELTGSWKVPLGIHGILATTTGLIHGIDVSAYSLWKPTVYSVGGPLTFGHLTRSTSKARAKGLMGPITYYISDGAFADLLTDEAALRRHAEGGSEGAYKAGATGIVFFGSNGRLTIKPTPYMKEGYAIALNPKNWRRMGATDFTFKRPDKGDEIFLDLAEKGGYELRALVNHAPFCKRPTGCILLTDITNATE